MHLGNGAVIHAELEALGPSALLRFFWSSSHSSPFWASALGPAITSALFTVSCFYNLLCVATLTEMIVQFQ